MSNITNIEHSIKNLKYNEVKEEFKNRSVRNSLLRTVYNPNVIVYVKCKDGYEYLIKNILSDLSSFVFEDINGYIIWLMKDNIGSFKIQPLNRKNKHFFYKLGKITKEDLLSGSVFESVPETSKVDLSGVGDGA